MAQTATMTMTAATKLGKAISSSLPSKQHRRRVSSSGSTTSTPHVNGRSGGHSKGEAAAEGNHSDGEQDVEVDEDDRGEGTSASASGGAAAASLALASLSSKYLDVAALLKEPLVFVRARHPEEAQHKYPYEPLPTAPPPAGVAGAGAAATAASTSKLAQSQDRKLHNGTPATPTAASPSGPSLSSSKGKQVATGNSSSSVPIPLKWPQAYPAGPGYHNLGNTCFLNSVLQALTHTAPLVACLLGETHHSRSTCRVMQDKRYCLLCALQHHLTLCFKPQRKSSAISPDIIVKRLSVIAKGMRVGRQEDAHEFLRQALDKMQDSAAANMTPPGKTDAEKERTLISRIFGGKLRSRVECASCKANSDTFDAIMDLSLDVSRASTVKEALQAFVRVDLLQGQNKYKCEKCKKLVNARKSFSISEAPQILHIHFKRFTPTGRKITGAIGYPEELNLGPYTSDDALERNPSYRLYAIVCHSGGGPHSGHYYARVRSGDNRWSSMNDESVTPTSTEEALRQRNAYLLFYERTNKLGSAIGAPARPPAAGPTGQQQAGMKRKERDDDSVQFDGSPAHRGSPYFPAQQVKTNAHLGNGGPKPFAPAQNRQHQHQQHRNGSHSPSKGSPIGNGRLKHGSKHYQQQHRPSASAASFYGGNKHGYRPKNLVEKMQPRR